MVPLSAIVEPPEPLLLIENVRGETWVQATTPPTRTTSPVSVALALPLPAGLYELTVNVAPLSIVISGQGSVPVLLPPVTVPPVPAALVVPVKVSVQGAPFSEAGPVAVNAVLAGATCCANAGPATAIPIKAAQNSRILFIASLRTIGENSPLLNAER